MKAEQLSLFNDEAAVPKPKRKKETNPLLGPKSLPVGYNKYIQSKEWKDKRQVALKAANYKCSRCGAKETLQVHHLDYKYLYKERLHDVRVLCKKCHGIADSEREVDTAFETYARKKYGEDWMLHNEQRLYDEFEDWLCRKEGEYW
ncbi:MAG: HNH endonuclease signature motif containing protein [Desulfobacter sp.]